MAEGSLTDNGSQGQDMGLSVPCSEAGVLTLTCGTCGTPIKKVPPWSYEHLDGRTVAGHQAKP